jgi:hypothetical protein
MEFRFFPLTPGFSRVCVVNVDKNRLNGFSDGAALDTALKRGVNKIICSRFFRVRLAIPALKAVASKVKN